MDFELVPKLLSYLDEKYSTEVHSNVASILCGIVEGSQLVDPSSLANDVVSGRSVEMLLSAIVSGVNALLSIKEFSFRSLNPFSCMASMFLCQFSSGAILPRGA